MKKLVSIKFLSFNGIIWEILWYNSDSLCGKKCSEFSKGSKLTCMRGGWGACVSPTFTLTPNPTPCTINPTPYTLHLTPYTLHHALHTLHPIPYTRDPAPSKMLSFHRGLVRQVGVGGARASLHPTPPTPTLHPTPYTLHHAPYTIQGYLNQETNPS